MPELPEVETIVRGLRATLPGRCIVDVRLGKTDFIDNPAVVERELPGCYIASVTRYGKFVALRLRNDAREVGSLLIHLGMTGQLTVRSAHEPAPPHTHAFFALDDHRELRYTDARRFGRITLATDADARDILGRLGEDPLEISPKRFAQRIAGRRAMIKALLLDQGFLRGVGNIYADESLWRARIHPKRQAALLDPQQTRTLWRSMRNVLREAIRLRGSSVSDYLDVDGRLGEYQQRHRVYQREGKGCFRCGGKIRRAIVAGRSSYFCPRCQPARGLSRRKPAPRSVR